MGEAFVYPSDSYRSRPAPLDDNSEMVPYTLGNQEGYPPEPKRENSYHEDMMEFSHERQLHHMPSLSTTCTNDSLHDSMPSADTEQSAFDLQSATSHEFDWPISQNTFPWPPNRIPLVVVANQIILPLHRWIVR
jgi:hypothetical protein